MRLELLRADPGLHQEQQMTAISATDPDWSRERKEKGKWEPGKSLLRSIRDYQRAGGSGLGAKVAVLRHRFWSVVTGADIPLNCKIGGGLMIPHPNGIVIHSDAVIGPNCLILQQVTLGLGKGGVPTVGGDVNIGAGSKLLGGFHVGDHAVVAAMSVVTKDVPERSLAMGIPARIVRQARPGQSIWDESA
jgi:serine O-acetyltransferase